MKDRRRDRRDTALNGVWISAIRHEPGNEEEGADEGGAQNQYERLPSGKCVCLVDAGRRFSAGSVASREHGALVERQGIAALRQLDNQPVSRAFRAVILGEFRSQAPGLNANKGI